MAAQGIGRRQDLLHEEQQPAIRLKFLHPSYDRRPAQKKRGPLVVSVGRASKNPFLERGRGAKWRGAGADVYASLLF